MTNNMNSHELQKRIQAGDREAFRDLYDLCGRNVFLRAQEAFPDAEITRGIVKQVFLNMHHEIFSSDTPLDIDIRLEALTDIEIRTRRILAGDFAAAEAINVSSIDDPPAMESPPAEPETFTINNSAQDAALNSTSYVAEPIPKIFEQAEPYRTPLERAKAHMEAESTPQTRRQKRRTRRGNEEKPRGGVVTTILIIAFLLLFVWLVLGILMDFSILPRFNLGYRWFNNTIFPLFTLPS